jgi:hypothetical protein
MQHIGVKKASVRSTAGTFHVMFMRAMKTRLGAWEMGGMQVGGSGLYQCCQDSGVVLVLPQQGTTQWDPAWKPNHVTCSVVGTVPFFKI